jgi:hypothetical protein
MTTTHPPSARARWVGPAMLAVLLLAAALRIHNLTAQGMWGDEGWSIWLARGDTPRDLTLTMVADHHGPVYSLLLRGWGLLAGETVLALRWITVLFSIASIALIYALGRSLFNPAAGVGAALAFALMDKHVVLTQEVRNYPMVFLTMIVIALYYARWRRNPRGGNASWFVAWSVVGLYLHYYCYMVNLAILVHAGLTLGERTARRHFLALNGLIALAFAPWLPVVAYQFIGTPVDSEVLTTHGLPFNRQTIEYLASESFGKPVALYALLMVAGAWGPLAERLPGSLGRIPRDRRLSGALLAVLWFAVPILITWALHTRYPLITDRNISVIMPAIALLVGAGLAAFERFGGGFIAALILVNGLLTTTAYFDKPPWREMAADIGAAYPGGEPVLLDVEGAHAALWYHLTLELPVDVDHVVNLLPSEAEGEDLAVSLHDLRRRYRGDFIPRLQAILAATDGLWLAYWGDEDKKYDVFDALAAGGFIRTGTLEYEHHGHPIYAYRYDRVNAFGAPPARYGSIALRHAVLPPAARPGETIPALLWWSASDTPPADYTVSVFLLDAAGTLRAQHDGFPAGGERPTSAWAAGEIVFDAHSIRLPAGLPPGDYTVGVKLYTWWDGAILPTADGAEYATVGTLTVRQ